MKTELIQELKAKCVVREQRGTNAFDNYMVDRFDTERFAELIIRECAGIAHGSDMPGKDIKEYFGIAE